MISKRRQKNSSVSFLISGGRYAEGLCKTAVKVGRIIKPGFLRNDLAGKFCGFQKKAGIFKTLHRDILVRGSAQISAEWGRQICIAYVKGFGKAADLDILGEILLDKIHGSCNDGGDIFAWELRGRLQEIHDEGILHG